MTKAVTAAVTAAVTTAVTTAAEAVVSVLDGHDIPRVFCVAGESYLGVLDALHDTSVDVVTCRHEGSAAFAALATAKLTGRAGVCLVNRGPGATNAAIAVHAAAADATPLVLVVGQARATEIGRPAFQEIDCRAAFGGMAKGVWTVWHPDRAAQLTARAIRVAESGTPGPTVLVLPEDVLSRPAADDELARGRRTNAVGFAEEAVGELLAAARRPLVIAGSGIDGARGRAALAAVAERLRVPVVCTAKRQDLLDNTDPAYAGHLHLATPVAQREALFAADLLIAVGTRLDQVTTAGDRWPRAPIPRQPLIHVHADPDVLGSVHQPTVGLTADPGAFLEWLAERTLPNVDPGWAESLHAREVAESTWKPVEADDGVAFGTVVDAVYRITGGEALVTVDAGNFSSWVHRYHRCRNGGRLLGIAGSAMGFGIPAAVAAALTNPDRPVVAYVGDGGALMSGAELTTAVAHGLPLCVVIANNGSYGTIRQHQERAFPGRVIGTDLTNPDFAAWAAAHGALGIGVTDSASVEPAIRKALSHPGPSVVDVRTSLSHITAYSRLDLPAGRDASC